MHPYRYIRLAAAALLLAHASPAPAQQTPAPEAPAGEAAPPVDPAPTPPLPAPTPEAPALDAPAAEAPGGEAAGAGSAPPEEAPASGAEPPAAAQPEVTVTEFGAWEIGCLAGTTQCEMQQVAVDPTDNPVVLVRLVRLPEGADAAALAVFNTPLGTLLPTGLSFQIDSAPPSTLPFEWCVQEGCVVRLGLREPDVAAMKRGAQVNMTVTSIADPATPVALTLSLNGFTAGYDALPVPPATQPPADAPAPAAPAAAPVPQN